MTQIIKLIRLHEIEEYEAEGWQIRRMDDCHHGQYGAIAWRYVDD